MCVLDYYNSDQCPSVSLSMLSDTLNLLGIEIKSKKQRNAIEYLLTLALVLTKPTFGKIK